MTTVSVPIVLPDFTTFSIGALTYQGTWNASTNTPTLTSSVGTKGQYYVVAVAGTTSLNGHAVWSPSDVAIFNGTTWDIVLGAISSGEVITALGYTPANKAGDTITGPLTVSGASFALSGNISAAAWTTNGVRYKNSTATLTDTSSSGTVAAAYTDVWGGNTIAASSVTTFTNYYGGYYKTPVAGSNATLASAWALGADSLKINGVTQLGGTVGVNGAGSGNIALRVTGMGTTTAHGIYTTDGSGNINFDVLDNGSNLLGRGGPATNATVGFVYIPVTAGQPTGVPVAQAGYVAIQYDSTNHQFWVYDGGWKQPKTPSAAAVVTWQ